MVKAAHVMRKRERLLASACVGFMSCLLLPVSYLFFGRKNGNEQTNCIRPRWMQGGRGGRHTRVRRPPLIRSSLPKRLHRAAPGDDLIKHGVDRRLLVCGRLEDAELLEVREER